MVGTEIAAGARIGALRPFAVGRLRCLAYLAASAEALVHPTLLAERRDALQGAVLRTWLERQVLPAFMGRILPVTTEVARRSARLHVPDPRPLRDGLIAAIALTHSMTVVTRNLADFARTGVPTLNPWLPVAV